MRQVLFAVLLAGCAHAAPPAPSPLSSIPLAKPAVAPTPSDPGLQLEAMLRSSGLSFVTVEPGRLWMVGFTHEGKPPVLVHVVRGDAYVMIMGRLGTVPRHADAAFFRALARRNFDMPQLKIGVDVHDGVYASFEVPLRIVDREELLEDVLTLARAMDELRSTLQPPDPNMPSTPPLEPSTPPSVETVIEASLP